MKTTRFLILLMCSLLLAACSSDSVNEIEDIGSNNTTDIAVTGKANVVGLQAWITGYVNIATIDPNLLLLLEGYGIEYSTSPTFSSDIWRESVNGYTEREFTVTINGLKVNTTYYYRTYVVAGMTYYGKTESFTTDKITPTVSDISYTKAVLSVYGLSEGYVYISRNKDHGFERYSFFDTDYNKEIDTFYGERVDLEGLRPSTTYYCYFDSEQGNSETVSFTTKELDLSGVNVNYTYKPTYTSYTNWYGAEEDLTWLKGTYEYTITSNLGNKYKYGVVMDNKDYYSSNTNSPYNISVEYKAGDGGSRAFVVHGQISSIMERVLQGEANENDLKKLNSLINEVRYLSDGYPDIKAFIEIDGERIFIDDKSEGYMP